MKTLIFFDRDKEGSALGSCRSGISITKSNYLCSLWSNLNTNWETVWSTTTTMTRGLETLVHANLPCTSIVIYTQTTKSKRLEKIEPYRKFMKGVMKGLHIWCEENCWKLVHQSSPGRACAVLYKGTIRDTNESHTLNVFHIIRW